MTDVIEDIHEFWFGKLDGKGLCVSDHHARWFGATERTDTYCREQFGPSLTMARAGQLQDWTKTDRGLVALVILLDQFSRNIHRGATAAFANDMAALNLAREAISSGRHESLPLIHLQRRTLLLADAPQSVSIFYTLALMHAVDTPKYDEKQSLINSGTIFA